MTEHCEIAVVGGGVVGAAAALALSRAGFDVRLLERGEAPPAPGADVDPRVYAISPTSAKFLAALKVWPALPAERVCAYDAMRIWESRPERALHFDAAEVGRAQLGWIVEQSQILAALWSLLPAAVRRPRCTVANAEITREGGELHTADGASLRARLVLSAEGALSPLREHAGIETVDRQYEQHALVTHVTASDPHRGAALQRFLPGGPLAFLPLADGRRSIVWSLPSAEARRLQAMPAEDFHQRLAAAVQFETGTIVDSTPRFLFPLRLLHAQDYVRDALVLLGDSAHVIHPLAGQGVNLGLEDAAVLCTQLSAARDAGLDWSAPRVLRRYERARKAGNIEMLALTDTLDRAFRAGAFGLPRLLDAGLAALDRIGPVKQLLILRALGTTR